ncbi:MAG TPA: ABC transporter permease [Gemmatimonadaceae bacterium]|nr:ABC transporter permease [Gemmatimonadaceae bacterium]
MTALRVWFSRLRGAFASSQRSRELADEIDIHLRMLAEEHVRCGMSPAAAAAAARRDFGGADQTKEKWHEQRSFPLIDDLLRDGGGMLRMLSKERGFATSVILTLALAIGATTCMFSIVDGVLVRGLSYPDADRLVVINEGTNTIPAIPVNAMHFLWWQEETESFEQMGVIHEVTVNLSGAGDPELIPGARVSPNLFGMLGVHMQLGRGFTAEESQSGRDRVLVLEHTLWRDKFGADPAVIGRTVAVDGIPYEIVGVLPADFRFPALRHLMGIPVPSQKPQLWKPLAIVEAERVPIGAFNFICIAKLNRDVSLEQARLELEREQAAIARRLPQRLELHASVVPLRAQIVGRSETELRMLLAGVAVVLLIGCINIDNLLLVKTLGRRRELGIRAAIGAGRRRLIRQVLAESVTLSLIGGSAGILVASAILTLVVKAAPDVPRMDEVALDSRALAFSAGISLLIGLIVGAFPALRLANADIGQSLGQRPGGNTAGRGAQRMRSVLVGVEVALSALCLITGGLLLHSFANLLRVDRGFETSNLVTATVRLPESRYETLAERSAFRRVLLARLQALPGVSSVALVNQLPLRGIGATSALSIEGTTVPPLERPLLDLHPVNRDYFRTWGIPLKGGRLFDDSDGDRTVVIVSEFAAHHAWPNQNPIGKRVRFGVNPTGPLFEVIGIVGDIRAISLDQAPGFAAYVPYWQRNSVFDMVALKTRMEPGAVSSALRAAIQGLDPTLPVTSIRTMEDVVAEATAQRRFQMNLVLIFAAAALALAGLGIYGMLSYAVGQRTNEIGIRLALGTNPAAVLRMVVTDALKIAVMGLIIGIPLALLAASSLRSLLFGVPPADLLTIVGVCTVLMAVASLASYMPARRASQVDPSVALRWE